MSGPGPILPGATLGIFGSGQLGRMLALVARRMGYRVATYGDSPAAPGERTPTGQVADVEVVDRYTESTSVRRFLQGCDVVTFEFENVPASVAEEAAALGVPARPSGRVLATCQDRAREKRFLAATGVPTVRFAEAPGGLVDLPSALDAVGYPAVVKTAAFGYDGKGQWRLTGHEDLSALRTGLSGAPSAEPAAGPAAGRPADQPFVVEELVDLRLELSVIIARSVTGETVAYPAIENRHDHHILDVSVFPAPLEEATARAAAGHAERIASALGLVGVLAVEFFLTGDGRLLVNELAPRPHNSGHLTIEACPTSQFEQQLRAVCGLPLGAVSPARPAAMANLLGELWAGGQPDWPAALARPGAALHLYGKGEARAGRKMGHLTVISGTAAAAVSEVERARRLACRG
jgi:5-(carboxyamino)imidazole ribonucleotide synthase